MTYGGTAGKLCGFCHGFHSGHVYMFPGADAWEKLWVLFVVVILAHIVKSFEVYEGTPILRKTKAEAPIKEV